MPESRRVNQDTKTAYTPDHDYIGNGCNNPVTPVGPTKEEPRPRTEISCCKIGEGFKIRVGKQQFTHCPHYEEKENQ